MPATLEQFGKRVIAGKVGGPVGMALRGLLRCAEPIYAKAAASRNAA